VFSPQREIFNTPDALRYKDLTSCRFEDIQGREKVSLSRLGDKPMDKKTCSICAWRENCVKRFSVKSDSVGNVHCPDYSRDLTIKDKDLDRK
jgi:hypothetical protein